MTGCETTSADDIGWAERCGHWLNIPIQKRGPGRLPRQRHEPLVITGHGMGLRIDNGALVVRDGFTPTRKRGGNGGSSRAHLICRPALSSWTAPAACLFT